MVDTFYSRYTVTEQETQLCGLIKYGSGWHNQISCTVSICRACSCDFFPYASKITTGAVIVSYELFHYLAEQL